MPDVLFQAHSAPPTITFYDPPAALEPAYSGQALVAMHGFWNRGKRMGYKAVRIVMTDGAPTGAYEDFATGLVDADGRVWAGGGRRRHARRKPPDRRG